MDLKGVTVSVGQYKIKREKEWTDVELEAGDEEVRTGDDDDDMVVVERSGQVTGGKRNRSTNEEGKAVLPLKMQGHNTTVSARRAKRDSPAVVIMAQLR